MLAKARDISMIQFAFMRNRHLLHDVDFVNVFGSIPHLSRLFAHRAGPQQHKNQGDFDDFEGMFQNIL